MEEGVPVCTVTTLHDCFDSEHTHTGVEFWIEASGGSKNRLVTPHSNVFD